MKYLNELLARILSGENASDILVGLTPQNKGHVGEALLRLLVLLALEKMMICATEGLGFRVYGFAV